MADGLSNTIADIGLRLYSQAAIPACDRWSACVCRLLAHSHGLPQMAGESASALSLSKPAQTSLTLRPSVLLNCLKATFVTRRPPGYPTEPLVSYQINPHLWVEPSSTGDPRLRSALLTADLRRSDIILAQHQSWCSSALGPWLRTEHGPPYGGPC